MAERTLEYVVFKDIVQPFELGGETRLIRSAVKDWKPGKFKKNCNDTISREEHKTIFSRLRKATEDGFMLLS
jgi:hypothetical protein